ncbi:hypothetical protein HDU76_004661, partial [Blyttiomyces sp. JEL0837]
ASVPANGSTSTNGAPKSTSTDSGQTADNTGSSTSSASPITIGSVAAGSGIFVVATVCALVMVHRRRKRAQENGGVDDNISEASGSSKAGGGSYKKFNDGNVSPTAPPAKAARMYPEPPMQMSTYEPTVVFNNSALQRLATGDISDFKKSYLAPTSPGGSGVAADGTVAAVGMGMGKPLYRSPTNASSRGSQRSGDRSPAPGTSTPTPSMSQTQDVPTISPFDEIDPVNLVGSYATNVYSDASMIPLNGQTGVGKQQGRTTPTSLHSTSSASAVPANGTYPPMPNAYMNVQPATSSASPSSSRKNSSVSFGSMSNSTSNNNNNNNNMGGMTMAMGSNKMDAFGYRESTVTDRSIDLGSLAESDLTGDEAIIQSEIQRRMLQHQSLYSNAGDFSTGSDGHESMFQPAMPPIPAMYQQQQQQKQSQQQQQLQRLANNDDDIDSDDEDLDFTMDPAMFNRVGKFTNNSSNAAAAANNTTATGSQRSNQPSPNANGANNAPSVASSPSPNPSFNVPAFSSNPNYHNLTRANTVGGTSSPTQASYYPNSNSTNTNNANNGNGRIGNGNSNGTGAGGAGPRVQVPSILMTALNSSSPSPLSPLSPNGSRTPTATSNSNNTTTTPSPTPQRQPILPTSSTSPSPRRALTATTATTSSSNGSPLRPALKSPTSTGGNNGNIGMMRSPSGSSSASLAYRSPLATGATYHVVPAAFDVGAGESGNGGQGQAGNGRTGLAAYMRDSVFSDDGDV